MRYFDVAETLVAETGSMGRGRSPWEDQEKLAIPGHGHTHSIVPVFFSFVPHLRKAVF